MTLELLLYYVDMNSPRFSLRAAVYILLQRDHQLLFLRRFNTGWKDGQYTLPSGHVDGKESIRESMARETFEETGITINPKDLDVIHTMHRISPDAEYIDFYLQPSIKWSGNARITEPEKCDDLQWFDVRQIPSNVLDNVRLALELIARQKTFSELHQKS